MIPRQYEYFHVIRTNTKRFKGSPIIHMENLLNNDIKKTKKNSLEYLIGDYIAISKPMRGL